jgi:hypothetical protein
MTAKKPPGAQPQLGTGSPHSHLFLNLLPYCVIRKQTVVQGGDRDTSADAKPQGKSDHPVNQLGYTPLKGKP